jgi:hypothetical protein
VSLKGCRFSTVRLYVAIAPGCAELVCDGVITTGRRENLIARPFSRTGWSKPYCTPSVPAEFSIPTVALSPVMPLKSSYWNHMSFEDSSSMISKVIG